MSSVLVSLPNELFNQITEFLDPASSLRLLQSAKSIMNKFYDPNSPSIKLIRKNPTEYIRYIESNQILTDVTEKVQYLFRALDGSVLTMELYDELSQIAKTHWEEQLVNHINNERLSFESDTANTLFRIAYRTGLELLFSCLLNDQRVDPAALDNDAIRKVSFYGNIEMARQLLKDERVNPSAADNQAIRIAAQLGNTELVRLLLPVVNPAAADNEAIRWACRNGHLESVKLLLEDQRVDPCASSAFCIRYASKNGHLEVVKFLLTDHRVKTFETSNLAILAAFEGGKLEVIDYLLNTTSTSLDAATLLCHPRVESILNRVFIALCSGGHVEIVKKLLKDPRIDPTAYNNEAIFESFNAVDSVGTLEAYLTGRWKLLRLLLNHPKVKCTRNLNEATNRAILSGNHRLVSVLKNRRRYFLNMVFALLYV